MMNYSDNAADEGARMIARPAIALAMIASLSLVSLASAQDAEDPAAPPTLAELARREPAVAAVLELPRTAPSQQLRAVLMLIDLGHADAAGSLVADLLGTAIDDQQKAALVAEFGSAKFLKLIRLDPPTEKEGQSTADGSLAGLGQFAQSCLDAAAAAARDPARIAALIEQLGAPTEEARYAARVDLRTAGEPGMVAVITALAEADDEETRGHLLVALADMRPAVDEPLLALLADAQGSLRRDAAELAGHLRVSAALPWLSALAVADADSSTAAAAQGALAKLGYPIPTVAEAQSLLRRRLAGVKEDPVADDGDGANGFWWSWNLQTSELVKTRYAVPQLHALAAARLARALAEAGGEIEPADRQAIILYRLEEEALLDREANAGLREMMTTMSPAELSEALAIAAQSHYAAAAVQIAEELGRRGDRSILATTTGRPSPLAAALTSPDRALRFAALSAILDLAPKRSFPGSSQVASALWYFVGGAGEPTAVTAAPATVTANDWAGKLRGLGYDAVSARTGRDAILAAVDPSIAPRLAVVVLDSDIGQPLLGEVVYQLRANNRTAGAPILICSSGPRMAAAQRIADADPLVYATPRPHGDGALDKAVDESLALRPHPLAPAEVRTAQAKQALQWLAQLLAEGAPYDELKRDAALVDQTLLMPELTAPSLAVLAVLGTPESQTTLVDYASMPARPTEARREAADAFARSVAKFGVQLKREQILRQYDRYNASETADVDAQQTLGRLLDVIEKKNRAAAK